MAGGKSDEAKGRAKEAAGVLTGNEELEREGKTDQTTGKLKQAAGTVKDKVEKLIDKTKDKLS